MSICCCSSRVVSSGCPEVCGILEWSCIRPPANGSPVTFVFQSRSMFAIVVVPTYSIPARITFIVSPSFLNLAMLSRGEASRRSIPTVILHLQESSSPLQEWREDGSCRAFLELVEHLLNRFTIVGVRQGQHQQDSRLLRRQIIADDETLLLLARGDYHPAGR